MKTINILSLVLFAFALLCLTSCLKKGEDDPFISFRTRTARLTGQWHLTSGTEERTDVFIDSLGSHESKTIYIYTENTYQSNTESTGYTSSMSGSFSYLMEYKKNGEFSSTKTNDNNVFSSEGTWNFTKGIGTHKNKEQIVINLSSSSNTYTNTSSSISSGNTYTGNKSDITYTLKELRNSKLVLVYESTSTYFQGHGSSTKSELTFEQ